MSIETILIIVSAIFASTGFWSFIISRFQRKDTKKDKEDERLDLQSQMLKGLSHDRICYLGEHYIARGFITKDEYENLHDYLFVPYTKLGGNGTAEKLMKEVDKLPIKKDKDGSN